MQCSIGFLIKGFLVDSPIDLYRGALEALNESDREQYIGLIKNCLNKNFRYILSGFEYDATLKEGPPRPLPPSVVRGLFEGKENLKEGETDLSTKLDVG